MTRPRSSLARLSPTAVRLGGAFAAVLVLFGAALAASLGMMDRTTAAEAEVAHLDHAKHCGHMAAALVREQYIHQAHAIIEWAPPDPARYAEVARRTDEAIGRVVGHARDDAERALAAEVERLSRENDAAFREVIVPAIGRDARDAVRAAHETLEARVGRVVELNEQLNARFERDAADALGRAEAFRSRARAVVLACFGLALLVAAAVGAFTIRSVLGPIAALEAGAARVAAGDLSARVEVRGRDELASLARTFNHMTDELARQRAELLRAQRLASIGQIAAGVAHEINNPLGVILGYVKLMQRAATGSTVDELRILEDETRQCQRIVAGLLDLSRSGRLQCAPLDLAEIARESIARFDEVSDSKVRLLGPPAGQHVPVVGDASKLRQVTTNLLANALEASPPGSVVRVEARADGAHVELAVTDSGPGIAPEVAARIFDPFFTTKPRGTGLGLAISQAIVEAHGGSIGVTGVAAGGARFCVRLPAAGGTRASAAEEARA